jgi:hypothetical protein
MTYDKHLYIIQAVAWHTIRRLNTRVTTQSSKFSCKRPHRHLYQAFPDHKTKIYYFTEKKTYIYYGLLKIRYQDASERRKVSEYFIEQFQSCLIVEKRSTLLPNIKYCNYKWDTESFAHISILLGPGAN